MTIKNRFARFMFNLVPPHNEALYRFSRRYVDRFNGDNNSNPAANGEYRFLTSDLSGRKNATVFDVGANVGEWALFALSINPDIDLHCFEPASAAYSELAQKEWPSNVRLNRFALGERDGEGDLNIFGEASGLNSLYHRPHLVSNRITAEKIKMRTLDSYCSEASIRRVDLLKLDVEGHELAVMNGAARMLSEGNVDTVQFEYGGCALDAGIRLGDIWKYLGDKGFTFYKLFPEGPRLIEKYHSEMETFKYSNWVARRHSA